MCHSVKLGSNTFTEATIAQRIRLRLAYCDSGLESQAQHLRFHRQILYYICHRIEKREEKELGSSYTFIEETIETDKRVAPPITFVY